MFLGPGCGGTVIPADDGDASTTGSGGTGGAGVDQGPIPAEFQAVFATGTLCMPSKIRTGTAGNTTPPQYPVKLTTCLYRCVTLGAGTNSLAAVWDCATGTCRLTLVPSVHLARVASEQGCTASKFASPPATECTNQVFEWMIGPPAMGSGSSVMYPTGAFRVSIPFMTLTQGQQYATRVAGGESPTDALTAVVGTQNYPKREFSVEFDPTYPLATSTDALGAADCHEVAAP